MNRKSFVLTWFATLVATLVAVAFVPGMSVVGGNWAGPIAFAFNMVKTDNGSSYTQLLK